MKDYGYFGLQNGDGCFCGNDDSKFLPVAPEECDHPCSGDSNEICGSSWRLSVYGPNHVIDFQTATPTSEEITQDTIFSVFSTKSVAISGEIDTSVSWNDDLNNIYSETFQITATSVEEDLKALFELSDDVYDVFIVVFSFKESLSRRKKRQLGDNTVSIEFSAEVIVSQRKSIDEIETSLSREIENADAAYFYSFDPFDDFSIIVSDDNTTTANANRQKPVNIDQSCMSYGE